MIFLLCLIKVVISHCLIFHIVKQLCIPDICHDQVGFITISRLVDAICQYSVKGFVSACVECGSSFYLVLPFLWFR